MGKLMYLAEETNQILFEITLDKTKTEEKLSKIQKIVDDWNNGDIEGLEDTILAFHLIKEVLEDE